MELSYGKLKGKIVEKFGTQKEFSRVINISNKTLSRKLTNKVQFNQNEIMLCVNALGLDVTDIPSYFFVENVQSVEQK